jgi:hypothetical protein
MEQYAVEKIALGNLIEEHTKYEQGSLYEVHFELNPCPSVGWSRAFNEAWEQHIYMSKRRAMVQNGELVITCVLDDLAEHKRELEKVIASTNDAIEVKSRKRRELDKKQQATDAEHAKKIRAAAEALKGK